MSLKFICLLTVTLFLGYQLVPLVHAHLGHGGGLGHMHGDDLAEDDMCAPHCGGVHASPLGGSEAMADDVPLPPPPPPPPTATIVCAEGYHDTTPTGTSRTCVADEVPAAPAAPTGTGAGADGQPCVAGGGGNFQGSTTNNLGCTLPAALAGAELGNALWEKCAIADYETIGTATLDSNERPLSPSEATIRANGKGKPNTLGRLCFLKFLFKVREMAKRVMNSGQLQDDVPSTEPAVDPHRGTTMTGAATPYMSFFADDPSERSDEGLYPGGDFFKACQRIDYNGPSVGFNNLVKEPREFSPDNESDQKNFRPEYTRIMKEFHEKITSSQVRIDLTTNVGDINDKLGIYKSALESTGDKLKVLFSKARKCTAARFLVKTYIDWKDTDQTKKPADKQSFDGKIKCKSEGPETQDYWKCSAMVEAYNLAEIADKGITTVQQIDFMSKQSESQTTALLNQKDDVTAPLKSQSEMVRKQADVATLAGGVDIAKATVLAGAMSEIPTIEKIVERCGEKLKTTHSNQVQAKNYNTALAAMRYHIIFYNYASYGAGVDSALNIAKIFPAASAQAYAGQELETIEEGSFNVPRTQGNIDLCASVAANSGMNLSMNGPAKDAAKAAMVAAGLEGIANMAKGEILKGQANKIDSAIDGMGRYKPDLPTFASQDVMAQKCQADPTLPECSSFNFDQDVGFATNGITIGGMANGTSDASNLGTGESDGSNATAGNVDTNRAGVVRPMGASVSGIAKPSGLAHTVGAARFKSGGSPGGGGGGGGGPGTLGGGGGGGGGGDAGGAAGGAGAGAARNIHYDGGGAKLAYSGGAGGGKSSATGAGDNPFSKLFGKKDGESESSLEFGRGPASVGSQGANIFGMISNRYQQVNGSKRLLEYEAK